MDDFRNVVRLAQAGDINAFEGLVERFEGMVYAYCLGRLGDKHWAEDATQEVLLDAFVKLKTLKEPYAFPSWLKTIALKHSDRLLRIRREAPIGHQGDAVGENSPNILDDIIEVETTQQVLDGLHSLTPVQRDAVCLCDIADYPQGMVADFLGLPITTFKKRLHDGRARLRSIVAEKPEVAVSKLSKTDLSRRRAAMEFCAGAKVGDIVRVRRLLREHPDLIEHDYLASRLRGHTALNLAAQYGHIDIVKMLMNSTTNILKEGVPTCYPWHEGGPAHFAWHGVPSRHDNIIEFMIQWAEKQPFFEPLLQDYQCVGRSRISAVTFHQLPKQRFLLHKAPRITLKDIQPQQDECLDCIETFIRNGRPVIPHGPNTFYYENWEDDDGTFDFMNGFPVSLDSEFETKPLSLMTFESRPCATITHRGPYSEIGETYRVLKAELKKQGVIDTHRRDCEVYHFMVPGV